MRPHRLLRASSLCYDRSGRTWTDAAPRLRRAKQAKIPALRERLPQIYQTDAAQRLGAGCRTPILTHHAGGDEIVLWIPSQLVMNMILNDATVEVHRTHITPPDPTKLSLPGRAQTKDTPWPFYITSFSQIPSDRSSQVGITCADITGQPSCWTLPWPSS